MRTMLTRKELIEYGVSDNKWLLIGLFTLFHFLATMACVVVSFGAGMSRFDTGGAETLGERVTSIGANIVMLPLRLLTHFSLGKFDDLAVIANSLLWAVCFYGVLRLTLRRWVKARA